MEQITIKKNVPAEELEELGAGAWPIWEKEVSQFPWTYDQKETCLILEGEGEIFSTDGQSLGSFGKGDLIVFPAGLECKWRITEPIKKHYKFGE